LWTEKKNSSFSEKENKIWNLKKIGFILFQAFFNYLQIFKDLGCSYLFVIVGLSKSTHLQVVKNCEEIKKMIGSPNEKNFPLIHSLTKVVHLRITSNPFIV